MAEIMDMARALGGALARTTEHQTLTRAIAAADEDAEIAEHTKLLESLESGCNDSAQGKRAGRGAPGRVRAGCQPPAGQLFLPAPGSVPG